MFGSTYFNETLSTSFSMIRIWQAELKNLCFRCFSFFTGLQIVCLTSKLDRGEKREAIFPLIASKRTVLNDSNIKVLNKDESCIGNTKLNQWCTARKDVIIHQYTAFLATRYYLNPRLNSLEINYDLPNQKFSFSVEETSPFDLLCRVAISRTFRTEFHAMCMSSYVTSISWFNFSLWLFHNWVSWSFHVRNKERTITTVDIWTKILQSNVLPIGIC